MPALKAGYVIADITPPIGVTMAGYGARDHGSESVETPLSCCALVVEDGEQAVGMVFCDLIAVSRELVAQVRSLVAEAGEIAPDNVMLCGSHTHWGPEVRRAGYLPEHLKHGVSEAYLDCLARTIAGALGEAWRGRVEVAAGWGSGWAEGISFNRRPVTTTGQTVVSYQLPPEQAMVAAHAGSEMRRQWLCGGDKGPRLSPPLEGLQGMCAGVSDPELPFLKLLDKEGKPFLGLVNFACHPVVGGDDNFYAFSPDYPGEARKAFEAVVGCPLAFSLGCAGDQVPAWRAGASRKRVGHSLGAAAACEWYQVQSCVSEVPVRVIRRDLALAIKDLPSVEEARAELAACPDPDAPAAAEKRQKVSMAERFAERKAIDTEVWGMRLGDWAAVGLPGEIMAEIGLQIKQHSPFPVTAILSLCNDSVGYISTARAHREGGYEPTWSAPGPQAEEQIVDAALGLLRDLQD